jgi:NAD+ kinase
MSDTSPSLAFRTIGLLYHDHQPESRVMAAEILEFIEGLGATAWVSSNWKRKELAPLLKKTELLIILGGDGSMLRAARMASFDSTPVLGINMGHLGFLTEVQPAEWRERIEQALLGDYWLEKRMMIHAEHFRDGQVVNVGEGMNEVVVSRGGPAHVVQLHTYVNDSFLTTYKADGVIIATATGSTAYAMSAGGPILPPESKSFLLVPLAPHISLGRSIVLPRGATVRVQVSTGFSAVLTVDGQMEITLADGDEVVMRTSSCAGRFVRLQGKSYFYQTLIRRLGC